MLINRAALLDRHREHKPHTCNMIRVMLIERTQLRGTQNWILALVLPLISSVVLSRLYLASVFSLVKWSCNINLIKIL